MNAAAAEHIVHLGLGSNIQPERYIPLAIQALQARLSVFCVSSVWRFAAVGAPGPDFLNAALSLRTSLSATALKTTVLHPLEAELGRRRSADKFAPRTIDIDILVYGGEVLDPGIWSLAHLAVPLADCAPDLPEPGSERRLAQIAAELAETLKPKRATV